MFLHLGQETVIRTETILGIFDLDNTTVAKDSRTYLAAAEKAGNVTNVSMELPKSFVVCLEEGKTKVYISQLSAGTLRKRYETGAVFSV